MTSVQAGEVIRVRQHVGAAGDGGVAIALPQITTCCLDGGKARGACRVDAETRARESEEVADPTRYECAVAAGDEVGVDVLAAVHLAPVIARHTEKNSNAIALRGRRAVGYQAGHLQRLVCRRQGQPLRRVRVLRLSRRQVEEARIEHALCIRQSASFDKPPANVLTALLNLRAR